jgi:hypothetical protein
VYGLQLEEADQAVGCSHHVELELSFSGLAAPPLIGEFFPKLYTIDCYLFLSSNTPKHNYAIING